MIPVEQRKKYTADFETLVLTPQQIKAGMRSYVWAWALCDTDDYRTVYGTEIKTFISALSSLPSGSTVYFHNLKFDGQFIMSHLLNEGWKPGKGKKLNNKEYNTCVNNMGVWYSIVLKLGKKTIYIYDSLKKLPFKIEELAKKLGLPEEKGHIDYKAYRAEGGVLSEEDKDYIRRDVEIAARALKEVCFSKDLYKMTIGSDCMSYYKSITPDFKKLFPVLSPDLDMFCRLAYKGGYCYVNPKIAEKRLKVEGSTYDFNSLYPSVMHSCMKYSYPCGMPVYYQGAYEDDVMYPLYIQHFKAMFTVKEGYVPTVQIKNNMHYLQNEYVENVEEMIELYMTNVDLEIFFEHYDVWEYEPIDGLKFQPRIGMFDQYIDHWYKYKEEATINKDKVGRLVAKLMLNNLGGKYATSTDSTTLNFELDEDGILRTSNNYDEKDPVYVPVACFMTAYGRKELLSAIQANYDDFCYCDTDSIHITKQDADNIKVHDSALGYWKKESTWKEAKFIRQKTYAELIDGKWDIKAAGANEEVKANITNIDDFKIGASFPGRKNTKKVPGGIVLVDCNFTII